MGKQGSAATKLNFNHNVYVTNEIRGKKAFIISFKIKIHEINENKISFRNFGL